LALGQKEVVRVDYNLGGAVLALGSRCDFASELVDECLHPIANPKDWEI
jgi:hypothetical protein